MTVDARGIAASALVVNAFLQLADMATTGVALIEGHQEANPLSALIMSAGMGHWYVMKVALAVAFAGLVVVTWRADRRQTRVLAYGALGAALLMGLVVVNNVLVLQELSFA